jgi:ribonuclease HII
MQLKAAFEEGKLEIGVDEAGRGCYAGPVCAAAVVLPLHFHHPDINDSKKLKPTQRMKLREIIQQEALAYGVALVSHEEIDQINILKATFKAMHLAIAQVQSILELKKGAVVDHLLIDGNRFPAYPGIAHSCVVGGDALYLSIAAASILAKTERDLWMLQAHEQFPQYGWNKNKGYGTADHRQAIIEHGISPLHRKSFRLIPNPTLF